MYPLLLSPEALAGMPRNQAVCIVPVFVDREQLIHSVFAITLSGQLCQTAKAEATGEEGLYTTN